MGMGWSLGIGLSGLVGSSSFGLGVRFTFLAKSVGLFGGGIGGSAVEAVLVVEVSLFITGLSLPSTKMGMCLTLAPGGGAAADAFWGGPGSG